MEKVANLNLFDRINGQDTVLNQGEMGKGERCITQREYRPMVTNSVTNRLEQPQRPQAENRSPK